MGRPRAGARGARPPPTPPPHPRDLLRDGQRGRLAAPPPAGRGGRTRAGSGTGTPRLSGPTCSPCRRAGSSGGRTWRGVPWREPGGAGSGARGGGGPWGSSLPSRLAPSHLPPALTDSAHPAGRLRRPLHGDRYGGGGQKGESAAGSPRPLPPPAPPSRARRRARSKHAARRGAPPPADAAPRTPTPLPPPRGV